MAPSDDVSDSNITCPAWNVTPEGGEKDKEMNPPPGTTRAACPRMLRREVGQLNPLWGGDLGGGYICQQATLPQPDSG